jgi:hypothetical protein
MNYSEARIQLGLWHWCYRRGQRWACPNVCQMFDTGECDLLTVMRSGLACEYEIKISRKDYRQEARKGRVELFERRLAGLTTFRDHFGREVPLLTPNFFSYVVPSGLISADEVPGFAGLIYADEDCRCFDIVKKPERIHGEIITDLRTQLGQRLMFRYWNLQGRVAAA